MRKRDSFTKDFREEKKIYRTHSNLHSRLAFDSNWREFLCHESTDWKHATVLFYFEATFSLCVFLFQLVLLIIFNEFSLRLLQTDCEYVQCLSMSSRSHRRVCARREPEECWGRRRVIVVVVRSRVGIGVFRRWFCENQSHSVTRRQDWRVIESSTYVNGERPIIFSVDFDSANIPAQQTVKLLTLNNWIIFLTLVLTDCPSVVPRLASKSCLRGKRVNLQFFQEHG